MPRVDTSFPVLRERHRGEAIRALNEVFHRMQDDAAARKESGASRLIAKRWDAEVSAVVLDRNSALASEIAQRVVSGLKPKRAAEDEYDPEVMLGWLTANADIAAEGINDVTEAALVTAAETQDDPVGHVFGLLMTSGVAAFAQRMVTTAGNFAARDAGRFAGAGAKVWQVNSGNPRSAHAAMRGQSVPMDGTFSNGMQWPGDPDGGADNNANCRCSMLIVG